MKLLLNKLKVQHKLLMLTTITLLSLLSVVFISSQTLQENLVEDRKLKTAHLTEVATNTVAHFYSQFRSGVFSEAEAKAHALAIISQMKYDEKEYFWVNTLDYIMLSHPTAKLINTNIEYINDPNGKYLFIDMVTIARSKGEGFVAYQWNKPGKIEPTSKISYIKLFGCSSFESTS